MSKTIQYPSDDFPGPTPVSVVLPDSWVVYPAPEVSFLAASPQDGENPRMSAVVSVRRVSAELSLEELMASLTEEVLAIPDSQLTETEERIISGRPALLACYTILNDDDGKPFYQKQVLALEPVSEYVNDAVMLTLTGIDESDMDTSGELSSIMDSLQIGL